MKTKSNKLIKIAIIEDNRFIRDGLKIMLDAEQDLELVGSYPSCESAFYYDDIENADVVIMDINLPGISGIEGVRYINRHLPLVQVIICTAYEDDENVFEAIKAGAVGFLSKKASSVEVIKTLRLVHNGGSPITPNVAAKIISFFEKQELKQISNVLSKIEKKILEKISLGKSYSTVTKELADSEEEILFQVRSIYGKLHDKLIQINI